MIKKSKTIRAVNLPPEQKTQFQAVTFMLDNPFARQVFVAGDFNSWSPDNLPLRRSADRWEISLRLLPGRYHYKFITDGNWQPDPEARENVPNAFGSTNSVIEIQP